MPVTSARVGAAQREPLAREREAALGLLVGIRRPGHERSDPQFGIDHDASPRRAVVVGVRVGEDPQRNPHLRGREAHAGRAVHRLEHVGDERPHLVGDLVDGRSGSVQDGIAHDANRENSHALSLSTSFAR